MKKSINELEDTKIISAKYYKYETTYLLDSKGAVFEVNFEKQRIMNRYENNTSLIEVITNCYEANFQKVFVRCDYNLSTEVFTKTLDNNLIQKYNISKKILKPIQVRGQYEHININYMLPDVDGKKLLLFAYNPANYHPSDPSLLKIIYLEKKPVFAYLYHDKKFHENILVVRYEDQYDLNFYTLQEHSTDSIFVKTGEFIGAAGNMLKIIVWAIFGGI